MTILFKGKVVDETSLLVTNINRNDYPDFVDAYFDVGCYMDGTLLSDDELNELTSQEDGLCQEMARQRFIEG